MNFSLKVKDTQKIKNKKIKEQLTQPISQPNHDGMMK